MDQDSIRRGCPSPGAAGGLQEEKGGKKEGPEQWGGGEQSREQATGSAGAGKGSPAAAAWSMSFRRLFPVTIRSCL